MGIFIPVNTQMLFKKLHIQKTSLNVFLKKKKYIKDSIKVFYQM